MLFEALILSGIILVIVNLGYLSPKSAVWVAGGLTVSLFFAEMLFFQPLKGPWWLRPRLVTFLQTILLTMLAYQAVKGKWKVCSFLGLSFATTACVYLVILVEPILTHLEHSELRKQYAFESMEERLPRPKVASGDGNLPALTKTRLEGYHPGTRPGGGGIRYVRLQRLHEEHWRTFIDSPSFGYLRRFRPTKDGLKVEPLPDDPVPQPGPPFPSEVSPTESGKPSEGTDGESLLSLHRDSFSLFLSWEDFGYVRSRREVAGFQPHGFRKVPEEDGWHVRRVDLIGLLYHEEPVVYLTDGLPRMDLARRAPTRPLNAFESLGLQELKKGEDLYMLESSQGMRMLGALRAISACVKCHGCKQGDLLGAFTYTLERRPR